MVVNLKENDYIETLRMLKSKGQKKGIVYDAIIAKATRKIGADKLVTINIKHYKKLKHIHRAELVNPLKPPTKI